LADPSQLEISFCDAASYIYKIGPCSDDSLSESFDFLVYTGLESQRRGEPVSARIQARCSFATSGAGTATPLRIDAVGVTLFGGGHVRVPAAQD
jgi:hypothetical protein